MSARFRARVIGTLVLSCGALAAAASTAQAQTLVFADLLNPNDPEGNSIRAVGTDGNGLHTLIATGGGVRGLDFDPATGFLYWTDVDQFVIRRAHLDGTGQQDLISEGLAFPSALRLDLAAGKMYWGDQTNEEVRRANLDGSSVEPVLGGIPFFRGLAIDHALGKVYWTTSATSQTGQVRRADFDGSNTEIVIPTAGTSFKPGNIAIDQAGGKIYWTDAIANVVRRANLNGSQTEDLYGNFFLGTPKGIVLDIPNGKVYFGMDHYDADSGGFITGDIHVMNFDGSGQSILIEGLGSVNDLALVLSVPVVCAPDYDDSGSLSVLDIFAYLNGWFAGEARADFNHMDGLNVQDIFDFLNAWFAGC